MSDDKIRSQLVLKPVDITHLDQFNELLRYVFQVTTETLEEGGYEEGELERAKRPVLERSDVIGWFKDDELISQICVYPLTVNIHGKIMPMGGVTGVGTYPEYSNMGLMQDLIVEALRNMRERGQYISYLFPYSVPFYRRKGWEIITDYISFTIQDYQLPKQVDVSGYIERMPIDHEDVYTTYDKFAKETHGALIRSKIDWGEYWRWENEEDRTAAIYYNQQDEPEGYILYWISEDIFHIKDIIYMNEEARQGLWNFISAHVSMVDQIKGDIYKNEPVAFLMEDAQIEEKIQPYFMGRIVDVEGFLREYPFRQRPGKSFHFVVDDPLVSWNQGVFGVSWHENGEVEISRNSVGEAVRVDIRTLTSMLMSYRRPRYFYEIERLITDRETLALLERAIPDKSPYFSDYF